MDMEKFLKVFSDERFALSRLFSGFCLGFSSVGRRVRAKPLNTFLEGVVIQNWFSSILSNRTLYLQAEKIRLMSYMNSSIFL